MSSPQVQIIFKPAYECIMSLITFVDRRLSKNSDMGRGWAAGVKEQLDRRFLQDLKEKSLQKDLSNLANFMALAHEQPVNTTREFLAWFTDRNIKELTEHFPISPDILHSFLANLEQTKKACSLLGEWDRQYFGKVDPQVIEGLRKDAREKEALVGEVDPTVLVERVTGGVVLDDIESHKTIILVPQYHARPFNYYEVHPDLFISFYPADPAAAPGEPSPQLKRLTSALGDESRLKILRFLAGEERTFTDIVNFTGLAKSTVHYHMILLRAAGLTRVHLKANDAISYSLRNSALEQVAHKLQEFIAQPDLTGTGETITEGKEE